MNILPKQGRLLHQLLIAGGCIAIFIFIDFTSLYSLQNNIFTLTESQIAPVLQKYQPTCTTLASCNLRSGDILLRRHSTSRTRMFEIFTGPYLTHAAVYVGDGKIVETVGNEPNDADEVITRTLSKSDWVMNELEDWVILRPKATERKLAAVSDSLIQIANDPDYIFGLSQGKDSKQTTCAQLIANQYDAAGLLPAQNISRFITPDQLFWIATSNSDRYIVLGYKK